MTLLKEQKQQLRKHFSILRQRLPEERKRMASSTLVDFIHTLPKGSRVLSFIPFGSEINITPANLYIVQHLQLIFPKVQDTHLLTLHIPSADIVKSLSHPNQLNHSHLNEISPRTITHVLVPGLAFDSTGYRLGYGGGYYDRWLSHHPHPMTIGVGYAEQKTEPLPREDHDVALKQLLLC